MGFIGKTLKFFRKWASQGILKQSTSDPITGKSYKIETSLDDFITNYGSASIEMGPSFVEIIAKKGANLGSPATETKIKLDGTTITLEGPEVIAPITQMLKVGVNSDGGNFQNEITLDAGGLGKMRMLGTNYSDNSSYELGLDKDKFDIYLVSQNGDFANLILEKTRFKTKIYSSTGSIAELVLEDGTLVISLDTPGKGNTNLTLDALSLLTLKTLLGL